MKIKRIKIEFEAEEHHEHDTVHIMKIENETNIELECRHWSITSDRVLFKGDLNLPQAIIIAARSRNGLT